MSQNSLVQTRTVRDILVVELPATLSAEIREPFNEKVEYALADTPAVVILDCSKVTQADDAGLAALDFLFSRAAEIDTPVVVAAASEILRGRIKQAGLSGLIEMEPSVEAALAKN